MLSAYIQAAIGRAHYERLPDDGTYYGEIPGFQGVWANTATLEACRRELQEVLEDWLLVGLRLGHPPLEGRPRHRREAPHDDASGNAGAEDRSPPLGRRQVLCRTFSSHDSARRSRRSV